MILFRYILFQIEKVIIIFQIGYHRYHKELSKQYPKFYLETNVTYKAPKDVFLFNKEKT